MEKQKKFEKELDKTHKNLLELSWYMRGGVTIRDLHNMPVTHIKHINEIIEKNFDTVSYTHLTLPTTVFV